MESWFQFLFIQKYTRNHGLEISFNMMLGKDNNLNIINFELGTISPGGKSRLLVSTPVLKKEQSVLQIRHKIAGAALA